MTQSSATAAAGHFAELHLDFDHAMARLPAALAKEGFGVLTQVDIQEAFKKKLGVDFRRYRIFGACNPALAHSALGTDLQLGVLLPCNVVLYEGDDAKVSMGVIDPLRTLGGLGAGPELRELADTVSAKLDRVLEDMKQAS